MSVYVISDVWRCEAYEGSTLLVLLALADYADHDGTGIYPKVNDLAEKARLSERAARNALRVLEEDSVLIRDGVQRTGRGQTTRYKIDRKRVHSLPPLVEKGGKRRPLKGAIYDTSPTPPYIAEPSLEPSMEGPPKTSPEKQVLEAVQIYNQVAEKTGWVPFKQMTQGRFAAIQRRVREVGGVEGWREQMCRASGSDFLTGRRARSGEYEEWMPNLDWFLAPSNFAKLIEGVYDNRGVSKIAAAVSLQQRRRKETDDWLLIYGQDGRWVQNDRFGIGPAPHLAGTLVTDPDMDRFPDARRRRDAYLARLASAGSAA